MTRPTEQADAEFETRCVFCNGTIRRDDLSKTGWCHALYGDVFCHVQPGGATAYAASPVSGTYTNGRWFPDV